MLSKTRRRAALAWVESLRRGSAAYASWNEKPPELDEAHWGDLQAGALLFSTRDAAIRVLDALEAHIARQTVRKLCMAEPVSPHIALQIDQLREQASAYMARGHAQKEAKKFCSECLEANNARVLSKLVERDGRVVQVRNGYVVPGPAFTGQSKVVPNTGADIQTDTDVATAVSPPDYRWPEGISGRVKNLFMLNADLRGDMSRWMKNQPAVQEDQA